MAISSYVKDNKKLYRVSVKTRDPVGKQILKRKIGITSEKRAREVEFEFKKELEQKSGERSFPIWEEWFDCCIQKMQFELRLSTIENYTGTIRKWVHPSWKGKRISEISRSDVHNLIFREMEAAPSKHTQKNVLKMVKRIFQMACEENILDRNPCVGVRVKLPEANLTVLNSGEVEKFLNEAKAVNHRFYAVWVAALMTGMRSGELLALQWNNVDLDSKLIRVECSWSSKVGFMPTKTKTSRVVPISEGLLGFLKVLKLQKGSSNFVLPRLWEWEQGNQAQITREFCTAAGVTPVRFHDLRATFITNLLAKGVALARVMSIVGHAELKTTNGYLRKAGVDVQGCTEELGYKLPPESEGKVLNLSGTWRLV
jgi:integrase